MKEIIIEVDLEGNVKIETRGYKGTACKDATKAIEKALGAVTSDIPTAEAHEREELHNRGRA